MKREYADLKPSYLGLYKVYCFKGEFSCEDNEKCLNIYEVGDFLPLKSNYCLYDTNLLIVDFINHVVHVVERYQYRQTIKIFGEINKDIYECFNERGYMSIDVCGNLLNIHDIYDLYEAMNSYPRINVYLEDKKYLKNIKDIDLNDNTNFLVINNINNRSFNNMILSGYTLKNKKKNDFLQLSNQIYENIKIPIVDGFREIFYDEDCLYSKINYFLRLINMSYFLEKNNIGSLIIYRELGIKKVTHIDKIKREIKNFLVSEDDSELELVFNEIFESILDEDYCDYIFQTVQIVMID